MSVPLRSPSSGRRDIHPARAVSGLRALGASGVGFLLLIGASASRAEMSDQITLSISGIESATAGSAEEQLLLEGITIDPTEPVTTLRIPLGSIVLGELSPWNPDFLATGTIRIQLYSPWGFFPRYRVSARAVTPPDLTPGSFSTTDMGLGVINIVAMSPRVARRYDYDPATVGKNIDGEPDFEGTVGTLSSGTNHTRLFQTRGFWVGETNEFTLSVAVGPQFYTPTTDANVVIEVEVRVL